MRKTKQLHFGLVLLISFLLFSFSGVLNQTVRWSDHVEGFKNGMFHVMFYAIPWVVLMLPWSLILFAIYRSRNYRRFRTLWLLGPSILILMISVGSLLISPPTPQSRFQVFAKTSLPDEIDNLQVYFFGGGFTDYLDEYYFETSPAEVHRLIKEMNLTVDGGYANAADVERSQLSRNPTFPPPDAWSGSRVYARNDQETGWYYELRADSTETKVFIRIGCT